MNPTPRAQNPQGNQKFVFVTQRPQTPVGTSQQNQQSSSQNTVVKFVQNANQTSQKIGTQQKLVVVSSQGNQNTGGQTSTLLISKPQQQQQQLQQQLHQQLQQQQLQQQMQQHQHMISADDLSHLVE